MRLRLLITGLAAAAAFAATAPAEGAPPAHAAAVCWKNLKWYTGATAPVRFTMRGVSCSTAGRVAGRYTSASRNRCSGNACVITWSDGWACVAASGIAVQRTGRLFTCNAGSLRVVAHQYA